MHALLLEGEGRDPGPGTEECCVLCVVAASSPISSPSPFSLCLSVLFLLPPLSLSLFLSLTPSLSPPFHATQEDAALEAAALASEQAKDKAEAAAAAAKRASKEESDAAGAGADGEGATGVCVCVYALRLSLKK